MIKKIMMLFRTGTRLALLIFIGLFITMCLVLAFFKPIYEMVLFLESTTLLGIAVTLVTTFISLSILAYGIFALKQRAMVLKYMDAIDYQVDKTAAFYDKTYDDTTPVSAYNQKRDESLELKVKYDIALNK